MDSSTSLHTIRRRRVEEWLPDAMRAADIDLFIVFTREGAHDPFSEEVGLASVGGRSAGLFHLEAGGCLRRIALAPDSVVPSTTTSPRSKRNTAHCAASSFSFGTPWTAVR